MVSHCLAVSSILPCSADIALIGLAVMGQNLILNMNDHGFVVSWSRWTAALDVVPMPLCAIH